MQQMKTVLITGIAGYVGGSLAVKFRDAGYHVLGLARKPADVEAIKAHGFDCVEGTFDNEGTLSSVCHLADAVIHAAEADSQEIANALIRQLSGSGKTLIYTSGSGYYANWPEQEKPFVFTEEFPLLPRPPFGNRIALNQGVLAASRSAGIRSVIIIPGMIYGEGLLLRKESAQIPALIRGAAAFNAGVYVGSGDYCWSHVHIDDLANLYLLALSKASKCALFFAENGMTSFKEIATEIHIKSGYSGNPRSLTIQEASNYWGEMMATVALGSDCRIDASKARLMLGWKPEHTSPLPYC